MKLPLLNLPQREDDPTLVYEPGCHRWGDGQPHDEAFHCFSCDRRVCGYCAEVVGSDWLCPDCAADPERRHG